MPFDDLITTIDSDDDVIAEKPPKQAASKRRGAESSKTAALDEGLDDKDTLNPDFTFDVTGDIYADILNGANGLDDLVKGSKVVSVVVYSTDRTKCLLEYEGTHLCGRYYCSEETQ